MIDKFKDFFRKRKTNIPEVPKVPIEFDSEYLVNFTNDIILPLNDINGVYIKKPWASKVVFGSTQLTALDNLDITATRRLFNTTPNELNNTDSFLMRYKVKLSNNVDLTEFKLELLNCKSHLESEDLILDLKGEKKLIINLNGGKSTSADVDLNFDNFDKEGMISMIPSNIIRSMQNPETLIPWQKFDIIVTTKK
jgi:hypothetical protein